MLKNRIRSCGRTLAFLAAVLAFTLGTFAQSAQIPQRSPEQVCTDGIHMFDPENGLAVDGVRSVKTNGVWSWSADRAFQTRDGGKTWKKVSASTAIVWQNGRVHLYDGWEFQFAHLAGETVNGRTSYFSLNDSCDVLYLNGNNGLAEHDEYGAGSRVAEILQTTDGGANWTPIHGSNDPIYLSNIGGDKMDFCAPKTFIIRKGDLADEKPKGVLRLSVSSDLGTTWTNLEMALPAECNGGLVVPCCGAYKGGRGILPVLVRNPNLQAPGLFALVVYRTENSGLSWTCSAGVLDHLENWPNVMVIGVDKIIVFKGDKFYTSDDAGDHWALVEPKFVPGTEFNASSCGIQFVNASCGWATIRRENSSVLYKTTDGGRTWNQLIPQVIE